MCHCEWKRNQINIKYQCSNLKLFLPNVCFADHFSFSLTRSILNCINKRKTEQIFCMSLVNIKLGYEYCYQRR